MAAVACWRECAEDMWRKSSLRKTVGGRSKRDGR
jgi:hypothetical protein